LEQRNKENRQKKKFQTSTCAKQETPKKNAKHMQNRKYQKKIKIAGQVGQLLVSTVTLKKNRAKT
jgi:hypothetical protein